MFSGGGLEAQTGSQAKKARQKLIESLHRKSKFSTTEVDVLVRLYTRSLPSGGGALDEVAFKDTIHGLLGLAEETILERIFKVFDEDGDNCVSLEEWIVGLSTVLRGDLEGLIQYCFKVYDLNGDGYIAKDDIIFLLKDSFLPMEDNEDVEEHVKNVAEIIIRKMDQNKDGRLSLDDFRHSVNTNRLLLEAFGPCLPNREVHLLSEEPSQ